MKETKKNKDSELTFKRAIGLVLLAFGGVLVYMAAANPQRLTGIVIMLVALVLMLPTAMQTTLAMLVGFGRSVGVVKTKPVTRKSGEAPRLDETIGAPMTPVPRPTPRPKRKSK